MDLQQIGLLGVLVVVGVGLYLTSPLWVTTLYAGASVGMMMGLLASIHYLASNPEKFREIIQEEMT